MKEHIWHLRRHLAARDGILVGNFLQVPNTDDRALVGNGVHSDGEAHLQAAEYVEAEKIGETLSYAGSPTSAVDSVLVAPSPLPRADETARHKFIGMARAYAKHVLGIDMDQYHQLSQSRGLTHGQKIQLNRWKSQLSNNGLHRKVSFEHFAGLTESTYYDSAGNADDGNELVAEAYHKGVNPDFPGYRWMVQKGFEADPRSEHPESVAKRALAQVLPALLQYDLVLSASHQPNMEIITAALVAGLGADANELFEIAGGAYGMGGGLQLYVQSEDGRFTEATLTRTAGDPTKLEKTLDVNLDTLNRYVA